MRNSIYPSCVIRHLQRSCNGRACSTNHLRDGFPLPSGEIERSETHRAERSETHRAERSETHRAERSEIRRRERVRGHVASHLRVRRYSCLTICWYLCGGLRIHPERTCPEGLRRRIHRERTADGGHQEGELCLNGKSWSVCFQTDQ